MNKTILILIFTLILTIVQVPANALTDKEQQEIEAIKKNNENAMKQIEEMQKQVEKAKLDNQKQMEELKKKSESKAAAVNNKPVPEKTEKFSSKDYSKYIPKKDNWKLTWVPKKIMDDNELKKYLKDTHSKVEHVLSKDAKKNAEQIIKEIKTQYPNSNTALANIANGYWVAKHPEEALYIMGIACNNDPTDPNNLNNYAAFLTMSGAPEKAIPILTKLNNKYPNNSTVLNNLGQAWFDLGDTQQAEKYLDGAIKAFAYHSQANYTKSIIEAARGNQAQAIAAMKRSIKRGYSKNKEHMLTKLGGKLDEGDLSFPMPQDPLGLEKFVLPPYPQSAGDGGLSQKWKEFQQQCSKKHDELYAQEMALRKKLEAQHNTDLQTYEQYKLNPQKNQHLIKKMMHWPPLYSKAMAKLRIEGDPVAGWDRETALKHKEEDEKYAKFKAEIEALEKQWAEGEQSCAKASKYIHLINTKYEARNTEYIEKLRKEINTRAYYLQYATPGGDDSVKLMEVLEKKEFITALEFLPVLLYNNPSCGGQAEYQKSGGQLSDFYDLHCDNNISVGTPKFIHMNFRCNKATLKINVPGLSYKHQENLETGNFQGSAEISAGIGETMNLSKYGPLSAELGAEMKLAGFIEFNNDGVTDFGGKISAGISAGAGVSTDAIGQDILYGEDDINYGSVGKSGSSTLVGAEGGWSWSSGISASGEGVLAGRL